MYSNGVVSRGCTDCIFYYSSSGLGCYCRSFFPSISLRWVNGWEYSSNLSLASAYDKSCDRYINFMDVLSDLRNRLDGGAK